MSLFRTRWAAIGAAVAVTLGGGGIGLVSATNPTNATTFIAITPCRVIDTRPQAQFNTGNKSSPLGPLEAHAVTATGTTGDCTVVPANADAVSLNVTALNATLPTFLAVYASDATQPDASSLNPQPGAAPTPNAVTTELSADGRFTIFNQQGSVDVIADINGYYVDHNHDDRYYTRTESDVALAGKSGVDHDHDDRYFGFGLTLQSAEFADGATKFGGTVSFPDAGTPTMTISFGLPPGRDQSRPILVQVPFSGPPNCAFVMSATGVAGPFSDNTRFLNAGWTVVGSPTGVIQLGPNPPGSGSSTTIVTLSQNSAARLGGGASIEMRLVRSAASGDDTCSSVNAVGGYSVEY